MKKNTLILLLALLLCGAAEAKKRDRVVERPRMGWRTTNQLKIDRIVLSDTATVLWLDVFDEGETRNGIMDTAHIRVGGQTLPMKGAVGLVPGTDVAMSDEGRASFRLIFPPIARRTEELDFIGGEHGWQLLGIDLTGRRYADEYPAELPELERVYGYPAQILNNRPLTDAQEQTLATLHYPFFAEVCHAIQAEVTARLEAAAAKQGYTLCTVPDVPADSLFAAIAARYPGRAVLVDFWATWCAPCRAAIREMEPQKRGLAADDRLQFVYLTGPSSPETTWRTMAADISGHHYRLNAEQWSAVGDQFSIAYIPAYVLIRPDGTFARVSGDHDSPAELLRLLRDAVAGE